jgi:hypothetical protein
MSERATAWWTSNTVVFNIRVLVGSSRGPFTSTLPIDRERVINDTGGICIEANYPCLQPQ